MSPIITGKGVNRARLTIDPSFAPYLLRVVWDEKDRVGDQPHGTPGRDERYAMLADLLNQLGRVEAKRRAGGAL